MTATAERIAEQRVQTRWGRNLEQVCEDEHGRRDRNADKIRWTFPDGSVITATPSAWDFGYPDCWCWQEAGHSETCEKRKAERGEP